MSLQVSHMCIVKHLHIFYRVVLVSESVLTHRGTKSSKENCLILEYKLLLMLFEEIFLLITWKVSNFDFQQ